MTPYENAESHDATQDNAQEQTNKTYSESSDTYIFPINDTLRKSLCIFDMTNDDIQTMTLDKLRKEYHKRALRYHPDKNLTQSDENKSMFQDLQNAYELLQVHVMMFQEGHESTNMASSHVYTGDSSQNKEGYTSEDFNSNSTNYFAYFTSLFENNKVLVKNVVTHWKDQLHTYVEQMCETMTYSDLEKWYTLLKHTQGKCNVFMSKELTFLIEKKLVHMKEMKQKQKETPNETHKSKENVHKKRGEEIAVVATLHDIIQQNLTKVSHNSSLFYVPLWYTDVYFDLDDTCKCDELCVHIERKLPGNCYIDGQNNLHVFHKLVLTQSMLALHVVPIEVDKDVTFEISLEELTLKQRQTIVCRNRGPPKIKKNDMYSTERADVYLYIEKAIE